MKLTVQPNDPNFDVQEVPCPWCDYVHILPVHKIDDFECSSCRKRFWIAPLTLISSTPPRTIKDDLDNVIGWQLSFGWLSQYIDDHA